MDNYSEENIIAFLTDFIGLEDITAQMDIFDELGITGDDFHKMIDSYSKKFHVDMTNYLWYFHTNEEGSSIGSAFFKAPYERVKRIPVTPKMLLDFANTGKWNIDYPEHSIPKRRYDLIINRVFSLGIFAYIIVNIIKKYWCN